jgi:uncharacterized protein
MVTNSPTVAADGRTPADVGLDHVDVDLVTSDGVTLAAWYVPGSNERAVVLLHGGGAGSNRTSVLDHAAVLAGNGYGVLLVDARGHGSSGGHPMEWGWHGEADVTAAVDYLASRSDVAGSGIAVVGMSMGGEEAITAAAVDTRISAVIAEGATSRVLADDDAVLPEHPGRWINMAADVVKFAIADLLTSAEPPQSLRRAVAAVAPRHILLITAEARAVESIAAAHFAEVSSDVTVWEVPGASHTGGLDTAPAEWERRVIGFLEERLGN